MYQQIEKKNSFQILREKKLQSFLRKMNNQSEKKNEQGYGMVQIEIDDDQWDIERDLYLNKQKTQKWKGTFYSAKDQIDENENKLSEVKQNFTFYMNEGQPENDDSCDSSFEKFNLCDSDSQDIENSLKHFSRKTTKVSLYVPDKLINTTSLQFPIQQHHNHGSCEIQFNHEFDISKNKNNIQNLSSKSNPYQMQKSEKYHEYREKFMNQVQIESFGEEIFFKDGECVKQVNQKLVNFFFSEFLKQQIAIPFLPFKIIPQIYYKGISELFIKFLNEKHLSLLKEVMKKVSVQSNIPKNRSLLSIIFGQAQYSKEKMIIEVLQKEIECLKITGMFDEVIKRKRKQIQNLWFMVGFLKAEKFCKEKRKLSQNKDSWNKNVQKLQKNRNWWIETHFSNIQV